MRVKRNKEWALAALLLLCMLTGCSGKMTPQKLMNSATEHMAELKSFSTDVDLDIELEDAVYTTAVSLDMTMENTTEPRAGHAVGTAAVKMRNASLQSKLEIYQVPEEEGMVTYSSMDGNWSREPALTGGSSAIPIDGSFFDRMEETMDSFHLAEQAVEMNGKACWQMFGNVTGEDLMSLLGRQMLYAYGLVDIADADSIAELEIPVIFEIYQEEILPAKMFIDMTDVMDQLYDEIEESANVNTFTIKLSFSKYDQVDEIVVPEEVRQSAQN